MKITAEFNSNEELLSFISTFGTRNVTMGQTVVNNVVKEPVVSKKVDTNKEVKKEDLKENTPKEETKVEENTSETKEDEAPKEDPKNEGNEITKEMVRAIFSKLIKAGKQKEAKAITKKYGADKLPDLAEEHYAAAYKDAEGLL